MSNDSRVLELRKIIDAKETILGKEPKAVYKTNLKYEGLNILTMRLVHVLETLASVLSKEEKLVEAAKLIGCPYKDTFEYLIHDLILRGKVLHYKDSKKELDILNKKLDTLRSEDLRKTDELDELESMLK